MKNGSTHTFEVDEVESVVFQKGTEEDCDIKVTNRNVLLECYVGQNCVNCPSCYDYEAFVESHLNDSDHHFIIVNLHAGALSLNSEKTSAGLGTSYADVLFEAMNLFSWPTTLINREGKDGIVPYPFYFTDIEAVSQKQFSRPLDVELNLDTQYNVLDRALMIKLDAISSISMNNYKLHVWLTEDNVEGMQTLPDGSRDMHYLHPHVFRASLSKPAGDDISSGHWECNYLIPEVYGMNKTAVKPVDLHVVAFVTDKTGRVVSCIDK